MKGASFYRNSLPLGTVESTRGQLTPCQCCETIILEEGDDEPTMQLGG